MVGAVLPTDLPHRISAKIKFPESGCWLWAASTDQKGYGFVWSSGHMHDLDGINPTSGSRTCRECLRRQNREYRARKKNMINNNVVRVAD